MAKKTLIWRGSKVLQLQPGYPKFIDRGEGESYRFEWQGPYMALMAQKPKRGDFISGFPRWAVAEVSVEPLKAGKDGPGVMRVTAESVVSGGTSSPEDETIIEIDSGFIEKDLFAHPRYATISPEEIAKVKEAIANNEPIPGPTLPGPLEEKVQELADLLKRGTRSYFLAAPQVRKTTISVNIPNIGVIGMGTRTTSKPHPRAPDGYQWLKTADKATRSGRRGKWERIEIWSAADEWSEALYGPQPSS